MRVIVFELDFIKPQLSHVLHYKPEYCISDVLKGEIHPNRGMIRYGENLALGIVQQKIINSSDFIQEKNNLKNIKKIINEYRPDFVFFDLPPIAVVDDALGFGSNADSALLVVEEGKNNVPEIQDSIRNIKSVTNFMGLIVNKSASRYTEYKYYK
jgi:Mrp family chromosome partitioning ATPase